MKFNDVLKKTVLAVLKTGRVAYLRGEGGIGKSKFLECFASEFDFSYYHLASNQLAEKADLTAVQYEPHPTKPRKNPVYYPHKTIQNAIDFAEDNPTEKVLLFLDEINRTSSDVTSALLTLSTEREIGSERIPKNIYLVAAGNDHGNVTQLDTASISRFWVCDVEPDLETFIKVNPNLHPIVKSVLEKNPDLLLCKESGIATKTDDDKNNADQEAYSLEADLLDIDESRPYTAPRTITACSDWLQEFDNATLQGLMLTPGKMNGVEVTALHEILAGFVGETAFLADLEVALTESFRKITTTPQTISNIQKPAQYDTIHAMPTVADIENSIINMNDTERDEMLLYCLYASDDNDIILKALAENMTRISPIVANTLTTLRANGRIDDKNLASFYTNDTIITQNLKIIVN